MPKRFLRRLSVWVCLPLVLAFADIPAMAEAPLQVDYGTIEAIEIYRASDNQPINVGTVLGGIAGGVIGHQIGSGRGTRQRPSPAPSAAQWSATKSRRSRCRAPGTGLRCGWIPGAHSSSKTRATSTCVWATGCESRMTASIASSAEGQ